MDFSCLIANVIFEIQRNSINLFSFSLDFRLEMPKGKGFAGCIKNLTFTSDGKSTLYDLGNPADGENYTPGCNEGYVAAPVALNLDMSFLIAFIVVFAIVIVSVIVAAVYRRKQNLWA